MSNAGDTGPLGADCPRIGPGKDGRAVYLSDLIVKIAKAREFSMASSFEMIVEAMEESASWQQPIHIYFERQKGHYAELKDIDRDWYATNNSWPIMEWREEIIQHSMYVRERARVQVPKTPPIGHGMAGMCKWLLLRYGRTDWSAPEKVCPGWVVSEYDALLLLHDGDAAAVAAAIAAESAPAAVAAAPAPLGIDEVRDIDGLCQFWIKLKNVDAQKKPTWPDAHLKILRDAVMAYDRERNGRGANAHYARKLGISPQRVGQLVADAAKQKPSEGLPEQEAEQEQTTSLQGLMSAFHIRTDKAA